MSDQIKELLTYPVVAAYEVLIDYPDSYFEVGQIIELRKGPDWTFHTGSHIEPYAYTPAGAMGEYNFSRYPKIFKKIK